MRLTQQALMRSAARFSRESQLREAPDQETVPPGREAHIFNLYEDLSMPLSDIVEIARLALDGKLENFQEKVDGQNVTFTVRDGVLRFFTKMSLVSDRDLGNARRKIGEGMGMDLAVINDKYGDRPGVAAAFSLGYEALESVALQFQDSLFKNGDVVVVSGLMTSVNPNTIIYDADTFRFITPVSLTDEPVDQGAYDQFLQQARAATTDAFSMDSVPTAKLVEDLETDDTEIERLMSQLESVVSDVGLSVGSSTVGEYVLASVEKLLIEKYDFIPKDLVPAVANRFATKRGAIANTFKKHPETTSEDYEQLKRIDGIKADIVAEAIVPLEEVIQMLGVMVINKLDLALTASNQSELSTFVKNARRQFESDGIIADEKTLERIRIALARLEANEDLFTKATEGIVFTFNGNTYKLTGLFTPINRLRGFFEYGSATLSQGHSSEMNEVIIRAARRFLQEGGDAFKDSSGAPLTVEIELANVKPTLRDFSSRFLEPLGLGDYGTIGSTGKASRSGDLDLAIPVPKDVYDDRDKIKLHKKEIVSNLMSLGAPDAKITASNIYVLFPISGETQDGEFVQIDLMPTLCVGDTCWLMSGVGDVGVKGTYRNQLLNLIARERGLEGNPREKMTIAYPGGLQRKTLPELDKRGNTIDPSDPKSKRKWKNLGPKISDPASILGILGVPAAPEDVETFEELVEVMLSDPDLSGYLPKFEEYMFRHLSSEKSAASARRAVDHINATIAGRKDEILAEVYLRRAVRFLTEAEGNRCPTTGIETVSWESKILHLLGFYAGRNSAGDDMEWAIIANENIKSLNISLSSAGPDGMKGEAMINISNVDRPIRLAEVKDYLTGIMKDETAIGLGLEPVPYKWVGGSADHDIDYRDDDISYPYEVKKMSTSGVLSKLGDATSRVFISTNFEIMDPLQKIATISNKALRDDLFVKSESLEGSSLPGANDLLNVLSKLHYVLFEKTYRKKESPGLVSKMISGALTSGFIKAVNDGTLIDDEFIDGYNKTLSSVLSEFSPTSERRKKSKGPRGEDAVDIKASLGKKQKKYLGKVSFDYFFDDLIYRMFSGPEPGGQDDQIDDELIDIYKQSIVFVSQLYPLIKKVYDISKNASSNDKKPFDEFISKLKYTGFFGVLGSGYKKIPCASSSLSVKSTTQGFRAVLHIKET